MTKTIKKDLQDLSNILRKLNMTAFYKSNLTDTQIKHLNNLEVQQITKNTYGFNSKNLGTNLFFTQ